MVIWEKSRNLPTFTRYKGWALNCAIKSKNLERPFPMSLNPSHNAKCTPGQKEASNAGMEQSQFIRMALGGACEAFGVEYPHDLPERGKYDRSKIDWKKLAGLDE
jgi:hypothetical protein